MGENVKTVGFAALVCIVCSLLLAAVYSGLREEQERNKANDVKVKVLKAFGVQVVGSKGKVIMSAADIDRVFAEQIQGKVLDRNSELTDVKVIDLTREQINERSRVDGLKDYYPFYIYIDKATGKEKYAIHVSGMGLWSVVKAYIALEDDLKTIAGFVVYDHAETPGLGGEIEKDFFQNRFAGKVMNVKGGGRFFSIIKPGLKEDTSSINGISGATMTCNGVDAFINKDFAVYDKYFEKIRKP